MEKAEKITAALFKGDIKSLSEEEIKDAMAGLDQVEIDSGLNLVDAITTAKIASSKREAREWISAGSIQINGEKIKDFDYCINDSSTIVDNKLIVKRGKRNYYVIKIK